MELDNTNKQKIIDAIFARPDILFGVEFKSRGSDEKYNSSTDGAVYNRVDRIALSLVSNGTNIYVHFHGDDRESTDIFTYLMRYDLHTVDFKSTLLTLADIYGIDLNLAPAEREQLNLRGLMKEVAASMCEFLRTHHDTPAAKYLRARGLEPDGVHFGELSQASLQVVRESLTRKGKKYSDEDFRKLGLFEKNAYDGYELALPYYRNGVIQGFLYRNIDKGVNPKYMFYPRSENGGEGRNGYCDRLEPACDAVLVEGEIDAASLTAAGIKNVVAFGGQTLNDHTARLLKDNHVTSAVYVPDMDFDEHDKQKKNIIRRTIKRLTSVEVDGTPVLRNVSVSELGTPAGVDLHDYDNKIDANTYFQISGGDALRAAVELGTEPWWKWSMRDIGAQAADKAADGDVDPSSWVQEKVDAIIYDCTANPYEVQRLRKYVANTGILENYGVTTKSISDSADRAKRERAERTQEKFQKRVEAQAKALTAIAEAGADRGKVAAVVAELSKTQGSDTRAEWEQQMNRPFDEKLDMVRNLPKALKSEWELGNLDKFGRFIHYEDIEFAPANIEIFCAATAHGKTAFLINSALNCVNKFPNKTFIYVSCEENERQLFIRALNTFINIGTTDDGQNMTFVRGTRRSAILAAIKGKDTCYRYNDADRPLNERIDFIPLRNRINAEIERYRKNVEPRLKFVNVSGSVEAIVDCIRWTVEKYNEDGIEVGGVFLDYVQMLTTEAGGNDRTGEMKTICKALHDCALDTELPVVMGAQLNRDAVAKGIDTVTTANLGESSEIEKIVHNLYFIWQVDRTKTDLYIGWTKPKKEGKDKSGVWHPAVPPHRAWKWSVAGDRANRIFATDEMTNERILKRGYMYVEQLKARDGRSDGWGMFQFDGERGLIGRLDVNMMQRHPFGIEAEHEECDTPYRFTVVNPNGEPVTDDGTIIDISGATSQASGQPPQDVEQDIDDIFGNDND